TRSAVVLMIKKASLAVALLAVGGVALKGGAPQPARAAAAPQDAAVWACGESLKVPPGVAPQASNSVWSASAGQIHVYGGRQEYVAFQVIVQGGSAGLKQAE